MRAQSSRSNGLLLILFSILTCILFPMLSYSPVTQRNPRLSLLFIPFCALFALICVYFIYHFLIHRPSCSLWASLAGLCVSLAVLYCLIFPWPLNRLCNKFYQLLYGEWRLNLLMVCISLALQSMLLNAQLRARREGCRSN